MPKLALAAAISRGAQAFIQGTQQGHAYEQQQKLLKNQGALKAIDYLLQDENTPLRVKLHALDSIPGLMGTKVDIPLSQQYGLHDLLEQDIETESQKNEIVPREYGQLGTGTATTGDESKGELSTTTNIAGGTVDTPEHMQITGARSIKRGDLSPAEYKALIVRKNQELSEEHTLDRQQRIAQLNFDLQEKSYRANGFDQVAFEGYNQDGEYVKILRNHAGDTKQLSMPKGFKPIQQVVAETRATASGGLPKSIQVLEQSLVDEINPSTGANFTPEEAHQKALDMYRVGFTNTITKGTQTITGTTPPTPSQIADDIRANEQIRIGRQRELDDADAKFSEYTSQASSLGQQKNAQWEHFNGIKSELESLKSSEDFKDQDEDAIKAISAKQKEYDIEYQKAQDLESQYQIAIANSELWGNKKKAAESRLSTGTSTTSQNLTTAQKAAVQAFKKDNANNPKAAALSDIEIWNLIQQHRNK